MNQADAVEALSALAHPTRLSAFRLLVVEGPSGLAASKIAEATQTKPSTLSGHLTILRQANLVTATRHQREIHYAADLGSINALLVFLLADCCGGQVQHCQDILMLLRPSLAATEGTEGAGIPAD